MADPDPAPVPTPPAARPAATLVVLRPGSAGAEVLLVERTSRGSFAGNWVFPGGQVDPGDHGPDDDDDPEGPEVAAARRAAARETEEEAGLVIAPGDLVTLSHWMPPAETGRRFSTWFFLAALPAVTDVRLDGTEVVGHRWITAADALAERDRGAMSLVPPTWMTLWWLAARPDTAMAMAAARAGGPMLYRTHGVVDPDGRLVATMWEGDAAYESLDLAAPGPRRRLLLEDVWRVEIDTGLR